MSDRPDLTRCEALQPLLPAPIAHPAALEEALAQTLREAQAAWPEVTLDESLFLAFLALRLPLEVAPEEGLRQLRVTDLWIACACLTGDDAAVRGFHKHYYPEMERALRRLDPHFPYVEDIQQMVYERVFIGTDEHPPRVAQYGGRGSLRNWLAVMAVRLGKNLARAHRRERLLGDQSLVEELELDDGAELQQLKRLYRKEVNDAFRKALAALSSQDRNLLRYRFLDHLTTERIAALHRVHRLTVSRWFVRIQSTLLDQTRRHLAAHLGATADDVSSLLRMLQSQLDLSIRRHLGDPASQG